jgi:tetratricopeptide (TPR) repeat protein
LTALVHMFINRASLWLLLAPVAGLGAQAQHGNQDCDAGLLFQRVNTLLADKAYEQAARTLDQFQSCPDRSPLDKFQMGWLYGRARRFDKALKVFRALSPDVPDRLTHCYAVALSKFELADYQGAIDELKSLQVSGIADANSINLLAVAYAKLGLYKEAYQILAEEIQKDPNGLPQYLNLVAVCAEGGDFAEAAEVAAQATRMFPNSADTFIVRGAANSLLGFLDKAHEDFATAVRLAPERADARFFLALTDYNQGNIPDALTILKAAVQGGVADSDLHYLMAECLLKLDANDSNAALKELNRALDLNANSVSARTLRGKLLLRAGRPKEAVADLELAINRDPDSRAALYNLAGAYRSVGRTSEAEALFRQLRAKTADTVKEFGDRRLNEALSDTRPQR